MYHSDGYIEPIIEDIIEIGVDILNPIQPESMNPCEIKKRYGDRITLHGTISVQRLLPQRSREEVEEKIKEIIRCCAPGGGLILAPTHAIQPDTPIENVLTFYRVALREGKYPLKSSI
jgi:uroporphyrinogen decarboxylase